MIQNKLQNFITNYISKGAMLLQEGDKLFQVLKEKHPDADKVLLTGDGKYVYIPAGLERILNRFLDYGVKEEDLLLFVKKVGRGSWSYQERKKNRRVNEVNFSHLFVKNRFFKDGKEWDKINEPLETGSYLVEYNDKNVNVLIVNERNLEKLFLMVDKIEEYKIRIMKERSLQYV